MIRIGSQATHRTPKTVWANFTPDRFEALLDLVKTANSQAAPIPGGLVISI
jgi:hypothetical protein